MVERGRVLSGDHRTRRKAGRSGWSYVVGRRLYAAHMQPSSVAILISSLSLLIAGLALGWQVALYLLSAGRPRAILMQGVLDGGSAITMPVPNNGGGFDVASLRRQGFDGAEVIGVEVTNHGRLPVTVEAITLHPRGGKMSVMPVGERIGPDLPHTVAPGTNASWYMPRELAFKLAESSREVLHERVKSVYGRAKLATGKAVDTKNELRA